VSKVTIHREHPFADPPASRDALRQFRGRLPSPVTVVASGEGHARVGLTVSSLLVVLGEPGHLLAMLDPDSDLGVAVVPGRRLTVSVLGPDDTYLAEAFAGLAPAPGGLFRLGRWTQTEWGPVLTGAAWLGGTVMGVRMVGWAAEVLAQVDSVELERLEALVHHRGRYLPIDEHGRLR
jgi:flavin reductase (DIM6/NTAB) family NADH-FMN oxidoreductase RutF